MAQRLLLYGASGHGKVVLDLLSQLPDWQMAGWIDDQLALHGQTVSGFPVLGDGRALERLYKQGVRHAVMTIGDNRRRLERAAVVEEAGLRFATLVHPRATVAASATLGPGTVVMAGAIVHAEAELGRHVIVNTAATIDHECRIADGVHLGPGVHLAGQVTVGQGTLIGIGSCVIPGRTIGANTVVGAGSSVVADLPGESICVGTPARAIKSADVR